MRTVWIVLVASFAVSLSLAAQKGGGALAGTPHLGVVTQADTRAGWTAVQLADMNRDGMNDIVWLNPTMNAMAVWLMRGTHVLERSPVIPGPPGTGWTIPTLGDFNGDGLNDVLWYNPSANRFAVWLMNGTHVLAKGPELAGMGNTWTIAGGGDFNFDNLSDVPWFNPTTNQIAIWLMDGTQVLARGPLIAGPVAGGGWTSVATADFNRDGMTDYLLSNADRSVATVLLMDGVNLLGAGPEVQGPGANGWAAIYAADFNGDGMSDILWSNSNTGNMAVWLMNGVHVATRGADFPGPAGAGWQVIAADMNYDNLADAVWNNPNTNEMVVWLMSGTRGLAPGTVVPGPAQ